MLGRLFISVLAFIILLWVAQQIGKRWPELRSLVSTMPSVSIILLFQRSLVPDFDSIRMVCNYAWGNISSVFFYVGVYVGLRYKLNLNKSFLLGFLVWGIVGSLQLVLTQG